VLEHLTQRLLWPAWHGHMSIEIPKDVLFYDDPHFQGNTSTIMASCILDPALANFPLLCECHT
jgi:hypothetical protein